MELEEIQKTAVDYTVPIENLHATKYGSTIGLQFEGKEFNLNNYSSGQVATYAGIPTKYFRKLQAENPLLLADNVNHSFGVIRDQVKGKKRESRMLRTVEKNGDRHVRGFVSGKYKRLDSYDLVNAIYPTFLKHNLKVVEAEIDEKKFYLKAVSENLLSEVKKGDLVRWGIMFTNSDVGAGSLAQSVFVDRCFCDNGMVMPDVRRKYHIGRQAHEDGLYDVLSDRTISLDEQAFWGKLRDVTEASLNPDNFEIHVNRLREAASLPIKALEPTGVVTRAMAATGIRGEAKEQSIVTALASGNEGAGLTKWGLINSFTRAAKNDAWTYEESVELEAAAGQILHMGSDQWERISA